MSERMLKCRICDKCEGIMIQTMCLMGCEIVCVPCQNGIGVFNNLPVVMIPEKIHDELYEYYRADIHKMAFEHGGATCAKCNKKKGNNCETCNIDYEYKFKRVGDEE